MYAISSVHNFVARKQRGKWGGVDLHLLKHHHENLIESKMNKKKCIYAYGKKLILQSENKFLKNVK